MTRRKRRRFHATAISAPLAAPLAVLLAVGAISVSACGRSTDEKKQNAKPSAEETGSNDNPLFKRWTAAGLTVSAFTKDQSGAIGADCQSGTVSGLDVVVCTFSTDAAAKAAEPKGFAWVGEATGAAVVDATNLLAVVDRRSADPSGRSMNLLINTFRAKAKTP